MEMHDKSTRELWLVSEEEGAEMNPGLDPQDADNVA